ncbi:histidine phosphatase family protein [Bifidobacterium sp. UBA744]|uniref:histidine phosphatase family protein n=1 Tax=Bifidobacterium sp. UBA744 TaxID=1946112 RepID=UPI0025C6AE94|nr:histidine phosphatase family protein [Bifidobacterium sp. UBA744]
MTGQLYLLRHGQTYWALSGQHTGLAEVPLTAKGIEQASDAGMRIKAMHPADFAAGYVSPLLRARQTAEAAGLGVETLSDLHEWDYGRAEGRTRGELSEALGRSWDLWKDGPAVLPAELGGERVETLPDGTPVTVPGGDGETLSEAYARAGRVVSQIRPLVEAGEDVLLVAHSHIIRLIAVSWLGLPAIAGRTLELGTAQFSVLGVHKGQPVIQHWGL